jgi:hypothetical protein
LRHDRPEGFNGEKFNKWDVDKKAVLLATLSRALLCGLYAYPMRQDAAPDENGPG